MRMVCGYFGKRTRLANLEKADDAGNVPARRSRPALYVPAGARAATTSRRCSCKPAVDAGIGTRFTEHPRGNAASGYIGWRWSGIRLLAPVVVLAQIAAALHFDQLEVDLAGVLQRWGVPIGI